MDGSNIFRRCLRKYYKTDPGAASWVVYAFSATDKPIQFLPVDSPDQMSMIYNVEMAYLITTCENSPFSTHMGISRNYNYQKNAERAQTEAESTSQHAFTRMFRRLHKNISIFLHAYGVYFTTLEYPNIEYFITSPLPKMGSFIINSLPEDAVWLGDIEWLTHYKDENYMISVPYTEKAISLKEYIDSVYPGAAKLITHHQGWSPMSRSGKYNISSAAHDCSCINLKCSHFERNSNFQWTLKNKNKITIQTLRSDEIEKQYKWFFHPTFLANTLDRYPYVIVDSKVMADVWSSSVKK